MRKRKSFKKALAGILTGSMLLVACTPVLAASMALTPASADAAKKDKKDKKAAEFDANGTYHARLGIQTADTLWIQRWGYFDKSANPDYKTDNDDKLVAKKVEYDGTFTDAEIAGNGTYTVSLDGADFSGETTISQLHVATDIPTSATDVKFSNVSLNINGIKVVDFEDGYMEDEDPYLGGGQVILLLNHWRPELINTLSDKGKGETAENGWKFLQGGGDETVSVTFTVSGFAYDNENAKAVSSENTDASSNAATSDQGTTSAAKDTKSSGVSIPIVIGGVVVVVIIAAVVVAVRKKEDD